MKYIFWICWISEMAGVVWWITDEMKLQYLKPNPFAFVSFLYLLAALAIRFGLHQQGLSNGMIFIPAIPLLFMLLMVMIHTISGGRWN